MLKRLREVTHDILAKSNAERDHLLAALKNGKITREQFKKAMDELNARTRKALHIAREKYEQALKDCYAHYLKNVRRILTDEQWKIWVKCHRINHKPPGK